MAETQQAFGRGARTFLEELSLELTAISSLLAHLAETEARRRAAVEAGRITAAQLDILAAARHARSAAFGLDLANPGWSLLLELMRARLEDRPARPARLATDARVALATQQRWCALLTAAGLAERHPDPARKRGVALRLTDAGAEAIHDYFAAVRTGLLLA